MMRALWFLLDRLALAQGRNRPSAGMGAAARASPVGRTQPRKAATARQPSTPIRSTSVTRGAEARQHADEINRSQIRGSKKEISERRGKCRCHNYSVNASSGEFGNRYPTADSLRQQGCRPETRRPLSSRRLVCPRGRRTCCLRRTWLAMEPGAAVELCGSRRQLGAACVANGRLQLQRAAPQDHRHQLLVPSRATGLEVRLGLRLKSASRMLWC